MKLKGVEVLHGKNETIKRIIEMQAEVAQKRGWGFVNFNTVMCGLNKQIQLSDSTATFCGGDRIHPDKDGHMVMAYLFLKAQGLAGQEIASFQINATNRKAMEERNCRISHIIFIPFIAFPYRHDSSLGNERYSSGCYQTNSLYAGNESGNNESN